MITQDLFDKILVKPLVQPVNQLYIVSGYATSAMAFHHLDTIRKNNKSVSIDLIVGMSGQDGLSESNHRGFQKLMQDEFPNEFRCSYITNPPSVHSKVYVWCHNDHPIQGFLGSANYTQFAFRSPLRKEAMTECSAKDGLEYFKSLVDDTIYCNHVEAETLVNIYNDRQYRRERTKKETDLQEDIITPKNIIEGLPHIEVSLLARGGVMPKASGLNWGQRAGREPNQAYLSLKSNVYNTDFFPERTIHFTVYTDDNKVLICTRAQDNGKAIHTPHNNSLIGEYFRHRLDLSSGEFVKRSDLEAYGRTTVDFYKIDDETYFMNFSV